MKINFLLIVLLTFLSCKQEQTIPLYIGTYTSGNSEGIYKLQFNTETGELKNLSLTATIDDPSFITYSPNRKYIYAVGEGGDGTISAFTVEDTGKLQLINKVKSHGGAPCYVSTNPEGNKLATSNYVGGNMVLYSINEDGSINEASQVFDHNSPEQKSHVHSAQFFENNLFVADLGRNAMYLYEKESTNNYKLKDSSIVKLTKNAGPRHFTLTNNGEFIYIINEYASTITTAKKVGDNYELINHESTLNSNYTGENACADIHLSQDESFLYGSNRGENSIAVFKRNTETGIIKKIQNISVHGDWPRNFTLDPSGNFLLVANKKSSNISVFSVDASSGKLSFLNDVAVPNPVCLLF